MKTKGGASQLAMVKGLVLRTGVPLPPAAGPARTRHTATEGIASLTRARRERGIALRHLISTFPQAWFGCAPQFERLDVPAGGNLVGELEQDRIQAWEAFGAAVRNFIANQPSSIRRLELKSNWKAAEKHARAALVNATDAFYWLDDLSRDVDPETLFKVDNDAIGTLVQLWTGAHFEVHQASDLVGGAFACPVEYKDGAWWIACPAHGPHALSGQSPGFTARYECTVCGGDPSTCPHLEGEVYPATAALTDDGLCTVCGSSACDHEAGGEYATTASRRMVDAVLNEVSLTPRPRDPLARIQHISADPGQLANELGVAPLANALIRHWGCTKFCPGFVTTEEILKPYRPDAFLLSAHEVTSTLGAEDRS